MTQNSLTIQKLIQKQKKKKRKQKENKSKTKTITNINNTSFRSELFIQHTRREISSALTDFHDGKFTTFTAKSRIMI